MVVPKKRSKAEKIDFKKAYLEMRRIATYAIDLADRCHGGHSYTSLRSTKAGKCCEVRMQVDDVKAEYIKISEGIIA